MDKEQISQNIPQGLAITAREIEIIFNRARITAGIPGGSLHNAYCRYALQRITDAISKTGNNQNSITNHLYLKYDEAIRTIGKGQGGVAPTDATGPATSADSSFTRLQRDYTGNGRS